MKPSWQGAPPLPNVAAEPVRGVQGPPISPLTVQNRPRLATSSLPPMIFLPPRLFRDVDPRGLGDDLAAQTEVDKGLEQQGDVGRRARDRVAGLTRGEHLGIRQVPRAPRVGFLVVAGPVGGDRDGQGGLEAVGGDGQQEPEAEWLHDDGAQGLGMCMPVLRSVISAISHAAPVRWNCSRDPGSQSRCHLAKASRRFCLSSILG